MQPNQLTHAYLITGMDCADCARTIENGVARLDGVQGCRVNLTTARLTVQGDVASETVAQRVRSLGYDVGTEPTSGEERVDLRGVMGFVRFLLQRRETALTLVGGLLVLPGLLFNELLPMLGIEHWLFDLTAVLAMGVAGFPVARSAWRSVTINRQININVLMTLAALGGVAIGAYSEAGLVMVLFALGEALEGFTMQRARNSLSDLLAVAPNRALVLRPCLDCAGHLGQTLADGTRYTGGPCPLCGVEEHVVDVANLAVGETIVVKPGEGIPMDGRVQTGHSAVNQAPITGESVPVDKGPADTVFAGSINGQGVLEIQVTALAQDNTLSRMVRLVEEAQEQQAPVQRFVDRFAQFYTPTVVVLALLVAGIPPLLWGAPFLNPDPETQGWLYRALALLVVACPCALVISTPVTIISAIANGARHGLLIKGGVHLETLAHIRVIAFDKTGTLTQGQPGVMAVRAAHCTVESEDPMCEPCREVLALAYAVEQRSEHPLARAVVAESMAQGVQSRYPAALEVNALTGSGVQGQVSGRRVVVGSHTYFDRHVPHQAALCAEMDDLTQQGQTPLLVSADEEYLGYISVADHVRESSRSVLSQLRQMGVEQTIMLTGDSQATAQLIASQVGITDVRAHLLPAEKVAAVRALSQEFGPMAMVGDGINDAPALAAAAVGIAMGTEAGGAAQALETADVGLMAGDLRQLPYLLQLSRDAMAVIRQNVGLSIGLKVLFLILVLAGWGSMWLAVLADVGTSLLVTLNGMRLNR